MLSPVWAWCLENDVERCCSMQRAVRRMVSDFADLTSREDWKKWALQGGEKSWTRWCGQSWGKSFLCTPTRHQNEAAKGWMCNISSSLRAYWYWSLECCDTELLCHNMLFLELLKLRNVWRLHQELPRAKQKEIIGFSCKAKYQPVRDKSSTATRLFYVLFIDVKT